MDKTNTPPAQPSPDEKPAAYTPPASPTQRKRSVVHYIAVLFAAAFLLMLLAYMMDRRENQEAVDSLNESVSGLRESISGMQSAQEIYEENRLLITQMDDLEEQIARLEEQLETSKGQAQRTAKAMDWFWQLNEAYVNGHYKTARLLVADMENAGVVDALPKESSTNNGRLSPAERYQEIYNHLFS